MQVSFPSSDAPSYPSLSVSVPDDWNVVVTATAVIAAVAPAENGVFASNLVVSLDRGPSPCSLSEASDGLQSILMRHPEAELVGSKAVEIGGRAAFAIEVAFRDPDAGTIVQTHRLVPVDAGVVTDLVHVVGSCAGDTIQDDLIAIREACDSIEASRP